MQDHARVVVIGGGVIGCSVLYHLTKYGWRDVVLLERKELTAGSTWHAAGGFHTVNGNANISRLQAYTCGIYKELEALTGLDTGAHYVGGLLVAATEARWNSLLAEHTRHKVLGLESELVGPDEIKRRVPIMDVSQVIGAIWDPIEGYIDPSSATNAYAAAARMAGAKIHKHTKVEGLTRLASGEWEVRTDKGTIIAEHVVNAAGLWAREVGRMAGVELPLVPMEHHYLITDDIPELAELSAELPAVADLDGGLYMRQERGGMLLGVYEARATPWAIAGTPWDYAEDELLVPDLERISDELARGFERFPAISRAGIKRIVNGPFTFSPDGNPLVGPVAGLPNYWVACGVMAGFVQGGGVGRSLAEWMIEGQATLDIFGMDIARFDPNLTAPLVIARAREFYGRRFDVPYPNEVWPVGRPLKTSPLYAVHKANGAAFISSYGYEGPAYFAPKDTGFSEIPTFGRSNAFDIIGDECRAARKSVGVVDILSGSKYIVSGADAARFLRKVIASPLPLAGQTVNALILSATGRMIGDINITLLGDGRYLMVGAVYMQAIYLRWFAQHQAGLSVTIDNVSEHLGGLFITGPNAVALLDALSGHERIGTALADGQAVDAAVGYAPCHVLATDRTGDRGFDLYTPAAYLYGLYAQVMAEGAALGICDIGIRALGSLATEQAPGVTLREISQDHSVGECGYGHLLDSSRDDYIGRDGALASLKTPPMYRLVGLRVDTKTADPVGEEPVWLGDAYVGYTSSGTYGHTVGYAMAMAFLDEAGLADGAQLDVIILGARCPARVVPVPFPKDPALGGS